MAYFLYRTHVRFECDTLQAAIYSDMKQLCIKIFLSIILINAVFLPMSILVSERNIGLVGHVLSVRVFIQLQIGRF
jgi:hypothetical protein